MPTCFVVMPITTPPPLVDAYGQDADHFGHVFDHLFRPALDAAGYEAIPPIFSGSDVIQGEIIRNLNEADLVLCDMTTLNANVFFELGIRTALDKPVATVRDVLTDRIPFDHSIVNCHSYAWRLDPWVLEEEIPKLAAHITACAEGGGGTNTLWKYFGIEAQARVGSAGTTTDDKLDYLVRQLEDMRSEVRGQRWTDPYRPASLESWAIPSSDLRLQVANGVTMPDDVRDCLLMAATIVVMQNAAFAVSYGSGGSLFIDLGRYELDAAQLMSVADLAGRSGRTVALHSDAPGTSQRIAEHGLGLSEPRPHGRPFAWIA